MNAKDLLRFNVKFTHQVTQKYLDDVTDQELFVRAVPGSNHLAWQLGHLVASERSLLEAIGADVPDLPEGFAETHGKDNVDSDDPSQFLTKAEYFKLMDQMHQAAEAAIDKTYAAGLDAPVPAACGPPVRPGSAEATLASPEASPRRGPLSPGSRRGSLAQRAFARPKWLRPLRRVGVAKARLGEFPSDGRAVCAAWYPDHIRRITAMPDSWSRSYPWVGPPAWTQAGKPPARLATLAIPISFRVFAASAERPPEAQNRTSRLPLTKASLCIGPSGSAMSSRKPLGAWIAPAIVPVCWRSTVSRTSTKTVSPSSASATASPAVRVSMAALAAAIICLIP